MNEQIRDAILTRLRLGHSREQIQQEFQSAGYDQKEFDQFFDSVTTSTVSEIPAKPKLSAKYVAFIVGSVLLLGIFSCTGYLLYSQNDNRTVQEVSSADLGNTSTTSPSVATTTLVAPADLEQSDIEQVIEQQANELSEKFTNDSSEEMIGFYEAYVEGVKFIEASSTPALVAAKNCLLNIYQNPSYSFSCSIDGIEGIATTPRSSQRSEYLFLTGPAVESRMFWVSSTQIPSATNISYDSDGSLINDALYVPEEFRAEALEFMQESEFATQHNGRHYLGGYPTDEPKVHLIAYIDLDDPFSKRYYYTILELRDLFTIQDLAIEVQQFPLTQLHPNANKLANASHCAAEQGDEYYWLFIKGVFDGRDGNSAYEMSQLPLLVQNIGLDAGEFNDCFETGAYMSVVVKHKQNIITTGAMGTPHTIVFNRITGASEPLIVQGAQPLEMLTEMVESILDSE